MAGVAAADAVASTDDPPGAAAIRPGVVGHDPLHVDVLLGVPTDGAVKESGAGRGVLASQDFGIGQPGVIVDGDVQVLPAGVASTPDAQ